MAGRKSLPTSQSKAKPTRSPRDPQGTASLTGDSLLHRYLPGGLTAALVASVIASLRSEVGHFLGQVPSLLAASWAAVLDAISTIARYPWLEFFVLLLLIGVIVVAVELTHGWIQH